MLRKILEELWNQFSGNNITIISTKLLATIFFFYKIKTSIFQIEICSFYYSDSSVACTSSNDFL